MGQQYLRQVSVSIDGGISFTSDGDNGPRVRFDTHQFVSSTPAHANIYVSNLSKDSYAKLAKENLKVTLSAGYRDGGTSIIFSGEIRQARNFREDITDVVTHIVATSSGNARNFATLNKTLAAGHTHDDRVQMALSAFKSFGVTAGHIDKLGGPKFPRGFLACGMAHQMLRDVCQAREAQWFNVNGRFHVLKAANTLPGSTIVLNSSSGLIGMPEQTIGGVNFQCLLNPLIVPGCKVKIDESSVVRAAFDPSVAGQGNNSLLQSGNLMGVQADGLYKVLKAEHSGDTRGNQYFTIGVGVGLNADSRELRSIGISDDFNNDAPPAGG
ncbi:hypothetical protein [Methylobacterium sp. WL116]|uniref:phage protein n=1 Tax=Methylobacterium sp. WL116 TaxID=2603889 RepID=UPI0011CABEE8|nr:hypothetical protein [Methylobacterium sp. WL116]TXM94824.1 hypothetical protein FV223_03240 [Methylobacterium sp. WL116]